MIETTKNIAKIKSLATYSDDGIPFQIPYDTAKRLQGDSAAKIYHLAELDQSEMRSEYFLVSLNGSLREGMLEEIEAIRVEETTAENRGAIDRGQTTKTGQRSYYTEKKN